VKIIYAGILIEPSGLTVIDREPPFAGKLPEPGTEPDTLPDTPLEKKTTGGEKSVPPLADPEKVKSEVVTVHELMVLEGGPEVALIVRVPLQGTPDGPASHVC